MTTQIVVDQFTQVPRAIRNSFIYCDFDQGHAGCKNPSRLTGDGSQGKNPGALLISLLCLRPEEVPITTAYTEMGFI